MEQLGVPTVAGALAPRYPAARRHRAPRGGFALAAVDIDDTLLGPDARISAANAEAVQEMRRRGVHVVLASGRSHANMLRFHHELGLGDGPVISAQGAVVRPADGGAPWLTQSVHPALVARATRDGLARGFAVQHYRGDAILVQSRTEWTEHDQSRNDARQTYVDDLLADGLAPDGAGVAKLIWLGAPGAIAAAAAEVAPAYAGTLTVTPTDPPYLEFYATATSKAAALAVVAERLGVPRERVLAFGDGNNDAPMLAWAGLGVAMPHARPAAREAATFVAPAGDPETALARAVRAVIGG
jgi:Cof subfamily protein (haloacid dehalogenase superfamily)